MENFKSGPVHRFLNFLFPSKCLSCSSDLAHTAALCPECYKKLLSRTAFHRCPVCGSPLPEADTPCRECRKKKFNFDRIYVAAAYTGQVKDLIHAYKFKKRLSLHNPLTDLILHRIPEQEICLDYIIPVPLSRKRLRERGFNQAAMIASKLSRRTGVPVLINGLRRIGKSRTQSLLKAKERKENVKGVFCTGPKKKLLKDSRILLVDDVSTTGSTLHEASGVLKSAGAYSVQALVIARTD